MTPPKRRKRVGPRRLGNWFLGERNSPAVVMMGPDGRSIPMPEWSFPDQLSVSTDTGPARWIEESLSRYPWATVGAVVPEGYDAYVRIDHPIEFSEFEGEIPMELLVHLLQVLGPRTDTPDTCWFCLWDGYGQLTVLKGFSELPRVEIPGREYLLLSGSLEDIVLFEQHPNRNTPNIWWPDDRAWCVATEIDADFTLIGGTRALIEELLADDRLASTPAQLDEELPGPRGE